MSVEESRAYFLGSDEGEAIWLLGGLYTFKALGEQTGIGIRLWRSPAPWRSRAGGSVALP